jgi:uncharacterized protein DUF6728
MTENKKDRASAKEYLDFNELFSYFFRKKKSGDEKVDFSLKSMHFVNKLSIIVFLLAIIYLVVRHLL